MSRAGLHVLASVSRFSVAVGCSICLLMLAAAHATGPADYAGKRLVIKFLSSCPSDPDPLGLLSSDWYSDCGQDELNEMHGWLASDLTQKNVFGAIDNANPELTLTVTLTNDHRAWNFELAAKYQVTDAAGNILRQGSVTNETSAFGSYEDAKKGLIQKIADDVTVGSPNTGAPSVSLAPPTASTEQQDSPTDQQSK